MFRQITIATITAAAMIGAAAPAVAENEFRVSFEYPAGASQKEVYASFKETAERACNTDQRRAGKMSMRSAQVQLEFCKTDLLAKAVAATGDTQLAALHDSETGEARAQLLARAD